MSAGSRRILSNPAGRVRAVNPPENPYQLARLRAGLNVEDVIDRLDGELSVSSLYAYERGERRPSARMIARLAELYSTSTDALLGLEPVGGNATS